MESTLYAGADDGTELIETMLWDGQAVPRLALHLARLRAGAAALGWGVPDATWALDAACRGAAARLRLTLAASGEVRVERGPVPAPRAVWRLGVAEVRLRSDDPWLRVKSTRRAPYDAARAAMAAGLDEVVMLNERGEVCDGTITTVFFDRGSGMRTPPLASGVLPGVLRAQMACAEEVLLASDLGAVRLWVGNSLRGLSRAVFDDAV